MSAEVRMVLAIASRLHMSAAAVEALSARELVAWAQFFAPAEADNDDAVNVSDLTPGQLRAMFNHGRQ